VSAIKAPPVEWRDLYCVSYIHLVRVERSGVRPLLKLHDSCGISACV
jgi:hypothetical protein